MIFTRSRPGTHDPATETYTAPTSTSIAGEGVLVKADPVKYQALELIGSQAPTVLFTPSDYGLRAYTDEFVKPGDTTEINGASFVVRDVAPVAPDGIVIIARIVVVS